MFRPAAEKFFKLFPGRIVFVVFVLFLLLHKPAAGVQYMKKQVHLDDLCQTLNLKPDPQFKAKVLQHLLQFIETGFAKSYQHIYKQIQSNTDKTKIRISLLALMLISHNFNLSEPEALTGKKFFLEKIKAELQTSDSIILLARLDQKFRLFDHPEIEKRFQAIVRQIWARYFKTRFSEKKRLSAEMANFLSEFSWLKIEIDAIIGQKDEPQEKWEFILQEGKTGENEEDFSFKKVN